MELNSDPSVLFEAENDDDTFYAEIRRQILLLTSEDNEDLLETRSYNPISVANDGSNRTSCSFNCASSPASNLRSWETQLWFTNPLWVMDQWKHGKGTGVFIPQVACKKNQRPGRSNNSRRKIYTPVVKKN